MLNIIAWHYIVSVNCESDINQQIMQKCIIYCLIALFSFCCVKSAAQEQPTAEQRELWSKPDFVQASLIVADPGSAVYSIFGHACFRLVCDHYDLDYCYTYEWVAVPNAMFRFFTGQLKMGMMAIPTSEYLNQYSAQSRGVKEYPLLLTIDAKRHLWQVLDEMVLQGCNMPYDYIKCGCASSCIPIMEQVLRKDTLCYPLSSGEKPTRREALYAFACEAHPWQLFFINVVAGTEIDKHLSGKRNIILPTQLVDFWQQTTVDGQPMLGSQPHELLPSAPTDGRKIFTPLMAAIILLIVSLMSWWLNIPWWQYVMLGLATVIGVVEVYLVCFTSLPCTQWNWLIVPFNILPAFLWRWRKYWAVPYAVVILLWVIVMAAIPHRMTDPACLILALAWATVLLQDKVKKHIH